MLNRYVTVVLRKQGPCHPEQPQSVETFAEDSRDRRLHDSCIQLANIVPCVTWSEYPTMHALMPT